MALGISNVGTSLYSLERIFDLEDVSIRTENCTRRDLVSMDNAVRVCMSGRMVDEGYLRELGRSRLPWCGLYGGITKGGRA